MSLPTPSHPEITLAPSLPTDLHAISTLECLTFYDEPFSAVAWGPLRASEANIAHRAKQLGAEPKSPNDRRVHTKAILKLPDGGEEIVGLAEWKFVTRREEDEAAAAAKKKEVEGEASELTNGVTTATAEGEQIKEEKTAEQIAKENDEIWGPGANAKFCEDVFLIADEHMLRSCQGKDYCKLTTLAIHPSHQRRGIGTMLLAAGLAEADALGLQTILAASPEGEGLYKRFGFREFEVMNLRLWEYQGGEGMGEARHCVMHRPATARKAVD